jgi:hypothetical protein
VKFFSAGGGEKRGRGVKILKNFAHADRRAGGAQTPALNQLFIRGFYMQVANTIIMKNEAKITRMKRAVKSILAAS